MITMLDNIHLTFFKAANTPWRQQTVEAKQEEHTEMERLLNNKEVKVGGKERNRSEFLHE